MQQPLTLLHFRGPFLLKSPFFQLRGSAKPFAIVNELPFRNRLHPLHARTVARFNLRQTQLSLYIVVGLTIHKSNCVRDRIRRRISEATRLALAEFGYRVDGSVLPVPNRMKETGRRGMVGTLVYHPEYKVVSAPWEELMADVKKGVEKFMIMKEIDAKNAEREMEAMLKARDARRAFKEEEEAPLASAVAKISELKARDEQERNRSGPKARGIVGDRRGGGAGLQLRSPHGPHGGDWRGSPQYQQRQPSNKNAPTWQDKNAPKWQDKNAPKWQDKNAPTWQDKNTPKWQDKNAPKWQDKNAPTWQDRSRNNATRVPPNQRDRPQSAPSWMSRGRGGIV